MLDRGAVRAEAKALSQVERRMLRGLGVRLGAFSIYLPGLLRPQARSLVQALAAREAGGWRPPADRPSRLPSPAPSPRTLSAFGLRAVQGLAAPVEQLERLDELIRTGVKQGGGILLSDQDREALGWSEAEASEILRGLGFRPAQRVRPGQPVAWRRRQIHEAPERPTPVTPNSPFAALAALKDQPAPVRRPRRRRRAKQAGT